VEAKTKAAVLIEALPYIKEHFGKTVVVKYGGKVMTSQELKELIASDMVLMKFVGMNPVVIHGGGPEITKYMKEMGKEVRFVDGLRVTDKETMNIVKMILVGKINKELVSLINRHGELSVGISGDDGGLIIARKQEASVDLGFVGEVESINPKAITDLIEEDFIPVVASVGVGRDGQSYNINADLVAGEIAAALKADKIIFLTDVAGLYRDFSDKTSLISELSLRECEEMVADKTIGEGMLPKVKGCIAALTAGVNRAHILNGTVAHALLLEVFTKEGIGTMITKEGNRGNRGGRREKP
jgi:acetylglutamate kinase